MTAEAVGGEIFFPETHTVSACEVDGSRTDVNLSGRIVEIRGAAEAEARKADGAT